MIIELQNTSCYTYNTKTNLFMSCGDLTGDYIWINDFTRRGQEMSTIFCPDSNEFHIIAQ